MLCDAAVRYKVGQTLEKHLASEQLCLDIREYHLMVLS